MDLAPDLWVDRHGQILFRYAYARICNHSVAEDLVQETFLAALRAKASFAKRSSERTWLIGILRNKIMDHYRREFRAMMVSEGIAPVSERVERQADSRPSPAAALTQSELWHACQECVSQLPTRSAQIFAMSQIDEVEQDEITAMLKISRGNYYVLLHRARMQLQLALQPYLLGTTREG